MNKVVLMGRLVREPEIRYTQGNEPMAIARYVLAVDRRYKKDGESGADFISCIAFAKSAEFAEKYLSKGTKIAVSGRIQTGSYTNRYGAKVYTTDVVVDEHEFSESKGNNQNSPNDSQTQTGENDFVSVPDDVEEDLPF